MRIGCRLLSFILLSAASIWADDKQVEDILKKQLVGNIVTLRGFYKGDLLEYDPSGQPRFKADFGPWTLYGKLSPTDVSINGDKLAIDGIRLLVAWRQGSGGTRHLKYIRAGRILIEVRLDDQHRDEASIQHVLARIFLNPADNLSELVPEHWQRFLSRDTKNIETIDTDASLAREPLAHGMPTPGGEKRLPTRIRVSQGVSQGIMWKKVQPEYPAIAKAARLEGDLIFWVVINKEGAISYMSVALPLGLGVEESAIEAVSQWKYRPYILNGTPVEVETTITVKYELR